MIIQARHVDFGANMLGFLMQTAVHPRLYLRWGRSGAPETPSEFESSLGGRVALSILSNEWMGPQYWQSEGMQANAGNLISCDTYIISYNLYFDELIHPLASKGMNMSSRKARIRLDSHHAVGSLELEVRFRSFCQCSDA